jgi:hypothetical protein
MNPNIDPNNLDVNSFETTEVETTLDAQEGSDLITCYTCPHSQQCPDTLLCDTDHCPVSIDPQCQETNNCTQPGYCITDAC